VEMLGGIRRLHAIDLTNEETVEIIILKIHESVVQLNPRTLSPSIFCSYVPLGGGPSGLHQGKCRMCPHICSTKRKGISEIDRE
jgi:hypothetical protein